MEQIKYYQRDITVEEFIKIRRLVGWDIPPKKVVNLFKAGIDYFRKEWFK